jgi:hypothetical protein
MTDDEPTDQIFLPWQEVARAIAPYLYAIHHGPDGAAFELIPAPKGVIIKLVRENPEASQDNP